jgi:hypothetical protein
MYPLNITEDDIDFYSDEENKKNIASKKIVDYVLNKKRLTGKKIKNKVINPGDSRRNKEILMKLEYSYFYFR